ncbi:MAG: ROK family protein [Pyrinomonadaceae bacterium]
MRQSETMNLVCAVDLGGTNLRAAIIDRQGSIHEGVRVSTPDTDNPYEIVSAIASAMTECGSHGAKRGQKIQAVSVVVPGSVHLDSGVIVNAPNVPSIVEFDLAGALSAELHRPVSLENDANAAAVGEMWRGAGRGYQTLICLTLGTGVGSGIILNGKLWRGIDGTGGEIGHASVVPLGGVKCKCDGVGCLEVYASATAIVRMTLEGLPDHSQSILNARREADLSAKDVAAAAKEGDAFALEIFRKMGMYLGVAMANLVNIFNPEIIIVGGGVSESFALFAPTAREEMMKRSFPVPARRCRFARAECGDNAGLLGAAWLAFGVR